MTLSLAALLERLDHPVAFLVTREDTAGRPVRHHTLRAAIEWSYCALNSDQQRLLRELAVFVSGARLDAIEAVSSLGHNVVPVLATLVDRNLVRRTGTKPMRYRLFETIREYAADQLTTHYSERLDLRQRHADYFILLAEKVGRTSATAADVSRLDEEQDEIRTAIAYLEEISDTNSVLALVVDCLYLWWDLGHVVEGHRHLSTSLQDCRSSAPADLLAAANAATARLSTAAGDPITALARARDATQYAQQAQAADLEALGLSLEGELLCWAQWSGSSTPGISLLEQAISAASGLLTRPGRWPWCTPQAVMDTPTLALAEFLRYRTPDRARALLTEARHDPSTRPQIHIASFFARAIGFFAADAGNWPAAEQSLMRSLAMARDVRSSRSESRTLEDSRAWPGPRVRSRRPNASPIARRLSAAAPGTP